jgi:hypothetical protein
LGAEFDPRDATKIGLTTVTGMIQHSGYDWELATVDAVSSAGVAALLFVGN